MENLYTLPEPILQENPNRFVLFPIEHHEYGTCTNSKKLQSGQQRKLT